MLFLPLVAEFLGTFLLLTVIFFTGNWLAIGLTLAGIVFVIGNVSGGHVNPAVSLAMFLKGSMNATELASYAAVQCAGAAAAFYTHAAII
jgi:glycerol uptake facilitator-like aquaporin